MRKRPRLDPQRPVPAGAPAANRKLRSLVVNVGERHSTPLWVALAQPAVGDSLLELALLTRAEPSDPIPPLPLRTQFDQIRAPTSSHVESDSDSEEWPDHEEETCVAMPESPRPRPPSPPCIAVRDNAMSVGLKQCARLERLSVETGRVVDVLPAPNRLRFLRVEVLASNDAFFSGLEAAGARGCFALLEELCLWPQLHSIGSLQLHSGRIATRGLFPSLRRVTLASRTLLEGLPLDTLARCEEVTLRAQAEDYRGDRYDLSLFEEARSVVSLRHDTAMSAGGVGDGPIATLLGSLAPAAHTIDLRGASSARVVAQLASEARLSHLRLLRLHHKPSKVKQFQSCVPSQLPELLSALTDGCPALEELGLVGHGIADKRADTDGWSELVEAAQQLRVLDLTKNKLGTAFVRVLVQSSSPSLQQLYLGDNRLGPAAATALVSLLEDSPDQQPRLPGLEFVVAASNKSLTRRGVETLQQAAASRIKFIV